MSMPDSLPLPAQTQTQTLQNAPHQPNPNDPKDQILEEWEIKTRAWLSTLPNHQSSVTINDMEAWIISNQVHLPDQFKSLSLPQLYDKVLSFHKLMLSPSPQSQSQSQQQVNESCEMEPPPVRFQRTDQWKPIYSWLESLDKDEVIKSKEIADWLAENPKVKEKLYSRHSRYHLMHYVQKLHMKILKKRGKLQKVSKPVSSNRFQTQVVQPVITTVPVKVLDNGGSTAAGYSQTNHTSQLKEKDVSLVKRDDAIRRYQLFTELEDHLRNLIPSQQQTT